MHLRMRSVDLIQLNDGPFVAVQVQRYFRPICSSQRLGMYRRLDLRPYRSPYHVDDGKT